MKTQTYFIIFLVLFFNLACGEENTAVSASENATTITIIDQTFVPSEITAAAGEIIYFYNNDATPHHILSESAPDAFDDTQSFDSEIFDEGDVRLITIPDTAVVGEKFYFYCEFTHDVMTTPNGTITVE